MDDLEITKACAEMMGYPPWHNSDGWPTLHEHPGVRYDPLHDDAQCFALVKRFRLFINSADNEAYWKVAPHGQGITNCHSNLNRAVCLCIVKLRARG